MICRITIDGNRQNYYIISLHDEKMDWDEYYGGPSRSMVKREALDVLALAKELVALSERELERVPLSDALRDQVNEAKRITANIAHKRQVQFLAKQMRKHEDELPAIRTALEAAVAARCTKRSALQRLSVGGHSEGPAGAACSISRAAREQAVGLTGCTPR